MVWIMNRIIRFVIITILLTLILAPIDCIAQAASGGTVTELSASYNSSTKTVKVTGIGENIAKEIVVIEILKPNGDLLYFGTAPLENSSFANSIKVGTLAEGTYKVRSADYTGGAYKATEFNVTSIGDSYIDDDTSSSKSTTIRTKEPNQKLEIQVKSEINNNTAIIGITGVIDENGKLTINVSNDNVEKIIDEVLAKAKEYRLNEIDIQIAVEAKGDTKSIELNLSQEIIKKIKEAKINSLTIETPIGVLSLDEKTLKGINDMGEGDLVIFIAYADKEKLSVETRELVGDRPVFDFSIRSGKKQITEFNGSVTVSIPYSVKPLEDTDAVVAYYINTRGRLEIVSNSLYNKNKKQLTFKTNHFSTFAVGYNRKNFGDVLEDSWYSKAVNFIAARNITTGTGENNYIPMGKLNRAQFIVMIMRAYGIQPDTNPIDNFSDGGNNYYSGYLSAAKRLNITRGVGNNMFLPDKEITRQEMFVLLYNTLKAMDELPTECAGKTIEDFSDENLIDIWAKDAMRVLVEKGIISGNNKKLDPKSTSTRGEMAQLIYNILKK